jgi:hypothetical protein
MRLALVLPLVLCLAACRASPTAPSLPGTAPGPNGGTWAGTVRDDANGEGDLRVVLQESIVNGTSILAGTWTTSYADTAKNGGGEITGGITGTLVVLTLRRTPVLACTGSAPVQALNGSYVSLNLALSGRTIAGSYTFQACAGAVPGTLTLTKQ